MTVEIQKKLNCICDVIIQCIETKKIYLFGSYAYGTPRQDSDFDICVIIPDSDIRPIDAIRKIRYALYPIQDVPLDILVYHLSDFQDRSRSASLERKISRDGVLLYA